MRSELEPRQPGESALDFFYRWAADFALWVVFPGVVGGLTFSLTWRALLWLGMEGRSDA